MYMDNYIDDEFMSYLNRHLTGITLLRNNIERVLLSYYLSGAFSNHSCRFVIDVTLKDFSKLTENEQRDAHEYFYNSSSSSGSGFVSFVYQNNRDSDLSIGTVRSFMRHYEFAQSIFEGFVRGQLPENCTIEVIPLEEEPFFRYIDNYLSSVREGQQAMLFRHRYFELFKRHLDFDKMYHDILKDAAVPELPEENTVSDIELYGIGGGSMEELRRFVVKRKIPFSIDAYSNVIDKINIDADALRIALPDYDAPDYSVERINPKRILSHMERKELEAKKERVVREQKIKEAAVNIGDYIYVKEPYGTDYIIGKVKSLDVGHSGISVEYATLKKDWSESKRTLKRGKVGDIKYILSPGIAEEEINAGTIRMEGQFVSLFKNKGVKPPARKNK